MVDCSIASPDERTKAISRGERSRVAVTAVIPIAAAV